MKHKMFLAGVLLLSAGFRLYALGRSSYWFDELVSLSVASKPGFKAIFLDNNPFLYHLLLKFWVTLFGNTETATRLLSAIFSCAATGVLFCFGRALAGTGAGILFALLHAVSPLSIMYAQEARMYALFEFLTALNMFFFYRMLKEGRGQRAFAVSAVFLSLSHYLAIVPLGLEVVWLYAARYAGKKKSKIIVSGLALAGLVSVISYGIHFSGHHLDWQKLKFEVEPNSRWPGEVLWALCYNSWWSVVGVFVIFMAYVKNRTETLFFSFLLGPLVVFLIMGHLMERSVFLSRYFIYQLPFFIAWIGLVLTSLWKGSRFQKNTAMIAAVLILVGSASAISEVYRPTKAPWRDLVAYISKYSASYVFTSRTENINTPYFDHAGIAVEFWKPGREGYEMLASKARAGRNVWVVDNYWGSVAYSGDLEEFLKIQLLKVEKFTFQTEYSEPLFAWLIHQ